MPVPKPQVVTAETEPFRALLYGDMGTGKTSLAATVNMHPVMSPTLVVNFDEGLASVTHYKDLRKVSVVSSAEMLAVLGEFSKEPKDRVEEYQDIKSVVVDSVTAWRDLALQEAVNQNSAREAAKGMPRGLKIPQIQDYGQMSYLMLTTLHGILQMPVHFIATAGMDEERDPNSNVLIKASPLLNPKLLQALNYMMSYIWFTKKVGENYRLLTLQRGPYVAKTRNPKFVAALKAVTRAQSKDKPDEAEGWLTINMDENQYPTPNLASLYDMYLSSQKENN